MTERWATLIMTEATGTDAVRGWLAAALLHWQPRPAARAALVIEELVHEARTLGRPPHVLRITTGADHETLYLALDDRTPDTGPPWPSSGGWTLLRALTSRAEVEQRPGSRAVYLELTFDTEVPDVLPAAQPLPQPRRSQR